MVVRSGILHRHRFRSQRRKHVDRALAADCDNVLATPRCCCWLAAHRAILGVVFFHFFTTPFPSASFAARSTNEIQSQPRMNLKFPIRITFNPARLTCLQLQSPVKPVRARNSAWVYTSSCRTTCVCEGFTVRPPRYLFFRTEK